MIRVSNFSLITVKKMRKEMVCDILAGNPEGRDHLELKT
jgi:hypothetical protein